MDDIPVKCLAHFANAIAATMAAVALSSWHQRNGNIAQHKLDYLEIYGAQNKTALVHLGWSFWLVAASLGLHAVQWGWTFLTSVLAQEDDPHRARYRRLANMSTEELIAYAQQARRKRQPAPKYREPHHLFLAEPPAYCEVMRSGFEREKDTTKLAGRPFAPDVFASYPPPLLGECNLNSKRRQVTDEPLGGWGRGRGRGRGRGTGRGVPTPGGLSTRGVSRMYEPRGMSPSGSLGSVSSLRTIRNLSGVHTGGASALHRSASQPMGGLAQPGLARVPPSPELMARQRQAFQAAQQRYENSTSLIPNPGDQQLEADRLAEAAEARLTKLMGPAQTRDPSATPSGSSRRWGGFSKPSNTTRQKARFSSQSVVSPSQSRVSVAPEQAELLLPTTSPRPTSTLFSFRDGPTLTPLWDEDDDDVILDLSPGSQGIPLSRQTASPDPSLQDLDSSPLVSLPDTAKRRPSDQSKVASFLQILDYEGNTDDEEAEA
jgi:hypothetical protein